MASKNVPVIDSIDFQSNKLPPVSDTSESKNHVLLPRFTHTSSFLCNKQLLQKLTAQIMRIQTTL